MSFTSNIPAACPVIDDGNYQQFVQEANDTYATGLIERDFSRMPYGSVPGARPFGRPVIPRGEWTDRIQDMETNKTRVSDMCIARGLKIKNQRQIPYCWVFAPTHGMEIKIVMQGGEYVSLSPASVGAKVKNFRSVGGWGSEAVEYMVRDGAVPSALWPDTAIDRRYDNEETKPIRARYQADEIEELRPNSFDELMTCLFLREPVAIGLNWWGHEILAVDPVVTGPNKYGVLIHNSWGESWGDNGRGVLVESKSISPDQVVIRSVTAS